MNNEENTSTILEKIPASTGPSGGSHDGNTANCSRYETEREIDTSELKTLREICEAIQRVLGPDYNKGFVVRYKPTGSDMLLSFKQPNNPSLQVQYPCACYSEALFLPIGKEEDVYPRTGHRM